MKCAVFRLVLVLVLILGVAPALAWDGVEVLAADGFLERFNWGGSPGGAPDHCVWYHGDSPDLSFHVSNDEATGYEYLCADQWLVHCDRDSLSFHGAWPLYQPTYLNVIEYNVELSCSVELTATTLVTARRDAFAYILFPDEHDLTITHPDGTVQSLFAAETGREVVELLLPPGLYQAALHVDAGAYRIQGQTVIRPYDGHVSLIWEDAQVVGVESTTWSSLKATYR